MSKTIIILLAFILHSICCLIIYYIMYRYLIRKWIKEYNKSYLNINDEYYKLKQSGYVYPSMGLASADRVHQLTGKSKLSK